MRGTNACVLLTPITFRRLARARDLLLADDAASVAEVARAIGVSPHHFIRQFAAVFGVTPHQMRIAVRIDRAKDLLARGEPVTDVCLSVGFHSLGSFSASFSRRVGEPPSSYRRRVMVQVPRPPFSCLGLMVAALSEKRDAAG